MKRAGDDQHSGEELIRILLAATGLPENAAKNELEQILKNHSKKSLEELTLDELRCAMAEYLKTFNPDSHESELFDLLALEPEDQTRH